MDDFLVIALLYLRSSTLKHILGQVLLKVKPVNTTKRK